MFVKILLLATIAVANARHVAVDVEGATVKSERCPAAGHHLLPHEWDCTKFYYCEYGQKWVTPRDCSPGTEFSYDLQVCIHPETADCQLSRVPPSSEESDESSESSAERDTEAPSTEVPSTEASVISTRPPRPTTTEVPSTEASIISTAHPRPTTTEAPTTEVPSTEASIISTAHPRPTTTEAPTTKVPSTEASIISTAHPRPTTTEVPSTEASVISTAHPRPTTTEAPTTEVPSTEASIISTAHPRPTTTEVPSTEASIISTAHPRPTTTEVPSTEASVISTAHPRPTTTEAPTTEVPSTEASIISTAHPRPTTTEAPTTEVPSTEASIISTAHPRPTTTEAPTEAPELELLPNGCPADFDVHLLLPHETRCDKFYYCVFGEKVVRNCAPNTYFNAALQTCDWAENVDCVNTETSESSEESLEVSEELEGSGDPDIDNDVLLPNGCPADFDVHKLLPHESDCAKFYYCVLGETVERQCAPGSLFNAEIQTCDLPENVECENNNSNENNGNSNEDNGDGNENNGNSNEDNGNSGESDILENGCPADFDVHQLLPHERDCSKFYYCVLGKKVERDCSPGNHFNPNLQVCDRPEDAGCANAGSAENGNSQETSEEDEASNEETGSGNSSEEVTTTIVPETEPTTPEPITITTEAPEIEFLPNGCPVDFDVHKLLPHESDCGKFYYCVFGETVERSCAPGTHFSPVEQTCDWPENVNCENSNTSNEDNEDNASNEDNNLSIEGSGNSIEDIGDSNENENSQENDILDNGCPADFDVHKLLPHAYDCGKFYYCVFGEKVERDCAPGTHFNPKIQVCDNPENVLCVGGAGSTVESSKESSSEEVLPEILPNGCPSDFDVHQLLPHEECGKFYYCVFGEKVERECAPGTHFNPALQVCDHPENVGCANAGSEENQSTDSAENGNSEENGASNENGNSGEDAASNENGNSEETGSGNSSEEATTTSVPVTDPTTPEPITITTEAPEIELLPNGCPADFDVHKLLPHESDCGKFYYCVFGEKVERNCAPGTHFSPSEQTCDWPENVQCENSNNSNEDSGNSNEGSGNSNEDNGNSDENNGNSEENGILDNGCPADFDVHKLLPHESDCGRFYYCVFGEKVERNCAPGTHFNPIEQVCDHPENAGCANADSQENESRGSAENETQETSEENVASNENGNSEENGESTETGNESNRCQTSCNVPAWAHEHDCDKFWRCDGENAVLGTCSEGLHFNVNTQTCDFICNAGCVRDDVQSTPEHDGLKLFLPWHKVDKTIRKLYLGGK